MTSAVLLDFYGTLAHAETWGPTRQEVLASRGFDVPDEVVASWRDDAIDGKEHVEHSASAEQYRAYRAAASGRGGRSGGMPFDFGGAGGGGFASEVDLGDLFGDLFGRAGAGGGGLRRLRTAAGYRRSAGRSAAAARR